MKKEQKLEVIVQIGYQGQQVKSILDYEKIKSAGQIEDIMTELETIKGELQDMYDFYKP
jgi:hypothetical protein